MVLPETEAEEVFLVAERLRKAVASYPLAITQVEDGIAMTVSIGLANFPRDGQSVKDLLEKADQAMYWAKRLGRNQVCKASELHGLNDGPALIAKIASSALPASQDEHGYSQAAQ